MKIPINIPQGQYVKAFYHLEDVNDSSLNGYNLTNNNNVTFTAAKIGNGANLGSANANKNLIIYNNIGITGGVITMCCWAKMLAEPGNNIKFFLTQQSNANYYNGYTIDYQDASGTKQIAFSRPRWAVSWDSIYYPTTLGTSNFNHFALTYDGTNLRGYFNGALVVGPTSKSGNGNAIANADNVIIGVNYSEVGFDSYASAIIDEVIIFNKALSDSEINRIYSTSGYFYGGGLAIGSPMIF